MKNYHKGFSLIELILYMGLTSTLIAVMSQVFLATLSVRIESEYTSSVQQDGRFIMARLGHDIRKAQAIISPEIGVASSSMTLAILEGGVSQTYQYVVDGSQLSLVTASGAALLHSDRTNISNFSIRRLGNSATEEDGLDTISIILDLIGNADVESGQQTLHMQTTISQR